MVADIRKMLIDTGSRTVPDVISGFLCDALYNFCGEQLSYDQDFIRDSKVYKTLISKEYSDQEVTDILIGLQHDNRPEQPKPNYIDRSEMKKQAEAGCGYISPEGDWK